MNIRFALCFIVVIVPALARAADPTPTAFTIEGTPRKALIFAPSSSNTTASNLAPVVFAFHGHGGSMYTAARKFDFQNHWPEAIIVYMQGLPTKSKIDPDGKLAGWQHFNGQYENRDLKFFDAVFAALSKQYNIDQRRVYATGFSNGGAFTYCLWANRPNVFAAVAPMAGLPWPTEPPTAPKPAFIVAGQADNLVPIDDQQATIRRVCELDHTANAQRQPDGTTLHDSSAGTPVVTLIHPGGHEMPPTATKLIVDFFRQHPPSP